MLWPFVVMALAGYLTGSLPTGWLVAKAYRVDIHSAGSGNIGATNVSRVLGKGPGAFVLVMDGLKGYAASTWLPKLVLTWFVAADGTAPEAFTYFPLVGGFLSIVGHNFPLWLGFRGGKGIATSAGVLAGLMPLGLFIALLTWILVFAFSGYVSLGSLAAAIALPIGVFFTAGAKDKSLFYVALAMGALALWKHRANIRRLRDGTEPRVGRGRAPEPTMRNRDEP